MEQALRALARGESSFPLRSVFRPEGSSGFLGLMPGYRGGATRLSQIALREPNWPTPTLQVAYSFSNQFELPVLFYVLTILEIITRHADFVFVVLAWMFVIARFGQAYVHLTSNRVTLRGAIYMVGALVLIVQWIG